MYLLQFFLICILMLEVRTLTHGGKKKMKQNFRIKKTMRQIHNPFLKKEFSVMSQLIIEVFFVKAYCELLFLLRSLIIILYMEFMWITKYI